MKKYLYILIFITSSASLKAELVFEYHPELARIQQLILDSKLIEAKKALNIFERIHPDNLFVPFLKGRALFFQAFLPDQQSAFSDVEKEFSSIIDQIEKGSIRDRHTFICSSELYLMQAFLHMRYGNQFSAAWSGYQAFNRLEGGKERFSSDPLVQFGNGLLLTTVGSLPENYRIFTKLIGMKGSVEKGMRLMSSALRSESIQENSLFRDEFAYMYCLVRYQLLEDSSELLSSFGVSVETSAFMMYMESLQLLQKGQNDKAILLLKKRVSSKEIEPYPYMDFVMGKLLLNKQDPKAAIWFVKFLNESKGPNHRVAAYRYLWWHYAFNNQIEAAENSKLKALNLPANSSSDAQAMADLAQDFPIDLIRARLLFDGGYDKLAWEVLNREGLKAQCLRSLSAKHEFHYRRGRVAFRQNNFLSAKNEFTLAIADCAQEMNFSCANSHLYLAYTFGGLGETNKAEEFYTKTLNCKGFPYYEGLHQKARTGLEELKKKS